MESRESDYTRFRRFVNRSKELAGLGVDVAAAHCDDEVAGGGVIIEPRADLLEGGEVKCVLSSISGCKR